LQSLDDLDAEIVDGIHGFFFFSLIGCLGFSRFLVTESSKRSLFRGGGEWRGVGWIPLLVIIFHLLTAKQSGKTAKNRQFLKTKKPAF
jgi:hypothetical protein